MDEDRFNIELRKFLKEVGVTSQREIERVAREGQVPGGSLKLSHDSHGRERAAGARGRAHDLTGRRSGHDTLTCHDQRPASFDTSMNRRVAR